MTLNIAKIADKPGVYLLKDSQNKILYVGKTVSLRKRLKTYLKSNPDPRINSLIEKVKSVGTYLVESELEALILEANLIKKYKPEFNVQLKDDKDYLYVIITKDKFPKVLPARKKFLINAKAYFGPFPSASAVRRTLKAIRRIFPYSTCKPNQSRGCLYYHIGLCPGVCVGKVDQKEYRKSISNISLFFRGKKNKIVENLRKNMGKAAKDLRFEDAAKIYERIKGFEYILQPRHSIESYVDDPDFLKSYRQGELKELKQILNLPKIPIRIEAYDISNLQGEYATGSMVVFIEGESDKREYRKFKIKRVVGISDTDMMKEILSRRFKNDWPLPDLILVDGGKGQLSAAVSVLRDENLVLPSAALAKKLEQIYLPEKNLPLSLPRQSKALHLLQRLRDEAHRFAISYHRHLRGKNVLTVEKTSASLNK